MPARKCCIRACVWSPTSTLTGAPRDAVETRLAAFVKSHIDNLLGPLSQLAAAEDVTGMARGVAFQLVEALGVLDRQRVADEVKGLEQPARASLRKYGVRFGAYHIYLPGLLKPAPRALALQLWALRHDGPRTQTEALLQLAGSGRTSIPTDSTIDAVLYRTAGYRVCGERAVRVDILERLADLIRPALSWREGAAGPKPPGAVAGGGFTVVNGMTSLSGASGEDFASILRSLGYRMERRPKPQETKRPQAEPAVAEQAVAEPASGEAPPDADALPASGDQQIDVTDATVVEEALQPAPESLTASPETAPAAAPAETPASEPLAATAEREMIEVWRPGRAGRPEGRRRSRPTRRETGKDGGRRTAPTRTEETVAAAPAGEAAVPPAPSPEPAEASPSPAEQKSRHSRHRRGGEHRQERQGRHERHERHERRERPQRDHAPVKRFERREKAPDPNSPFAKLAALKAQLEADAKERR